MSDSGTGNIPQPSLKRARIESDADTGAPPNPLEQKSDPWFEDGNIILVTATKTFRVYRGTLMKNSPIFADMFDLSQPHDAADGCPVVHLPDDPQDVYYFLKALFQPSFWANSSSERLWPFPVLSAFIRLGTKYEVEYLRKEALSTLIRLFPSTLYLFDHRAKSFKPPSTIIGFINLARQHNILRILPVAFYELSRYDLRGIFQGSIRPDGSLTILSREDQQICVLGRQAFFTAQGRRSLQWLTSEESMCTNLHCVRARGTVTAVYLESKNAPMTALNISPVINTEHMCSNCSSRIKNTHKQARSELWEMLPSIFSLPDWKELCAQCDDSGNFNANYSFSK